MEKLLQHCSAAVATHEEIKPVGEINSQGFNFEEHFEDETIVKIGRWWVCLKAKPWSCRDLMIIDSNKDFSRSFKDLPAKDLTTLTGIISESVEALGIDPKVKYIVIGANINPYPELADTESIARLHVHVCGFSEDEVNNFSRANEEEFPALEDKIISEFLADEEFSSYSKYSLGLRKKIKFSEIELGEVLKNLDELAQKKLEKLKNHFSLLSYSFAIKIIEQDAELFISPKSKNGRGVLESFGLMLVRDKSLKSDKKYIKDRDKFLVKVKNKLLKNPMAIAGGAKLEE